MPTFKDHLDRINDLALCRRNEDTPCAENAARNLVEGKAAYWYWGRSSAASFVAPEANRLNSLILVLVAFAERHQHVGIAEDVLDRLIPLNDEAVEEMELAYRLQCTFRDRDELRNRERDAIYDPYFPNRIKIEQRIRWSEDYEAARDRYRARQAKGFETLIPGDPAVTTPAVSLAISLANLANDRAAQSAVEGDEPVSVTEFGPETPVGGADHPITFSPIDIARWSQHSADEVA